MKPAPQNTEREQNAERQKPAMTDDQCAPEIVPETALETAPETGTETAPAGKASILSMMVFTASLAVITFALAYIAKIDILSAIAPPRAIAILSDLLIGIAATLPLALLLFFFMRTTYRPLVEFRNAQIAYFANIGITFTWPVIIALGLMAGIGEELLFRGVLQEWAGRHMPMIAAIIVTNIVFGLLHMRTVLYALIAGFVGIYMGVLYLATDDLLVPITTHALYDMIAFYVTRNAIAAHSAMALPPDTA